MARTPENWLYAKTAQEFIRDVADIEKHVGVLREAFQHRVGDCLYAYEVDSWRGSHPAIAQQLELAGLAEDQAVILEYCLPVAEGSEYPDRVDVILCGYNEEHKANAVLIELKQWSEERMKIERAIQPGRVKVGRRGKSWSHRPEHPSIKANAYQKIFSQTLDGTVLKETLAVTSLGLLHNCYRPSIVLKDALFGDDTVKVRSETPLYTMDFAGAFRNRLKSCVGSGRGMELVESLRAIQYP